jgi:hypothetical protein
MSYDNTLTIKACTCCNLDKVVSAFYMNGSKAMAVCKECWKDKVNAKAKAKAALKPKARLYKITSEAEVTLEMVDHYFNYDASTGSFTRRIGVGGLAPSGSLAGSINDSGYVVICMAGKDIRAHRLVWFMENGEFPAAGLVVDHINRNPVDNRIENLRVVSQKINSHNITKPKKQGVSGFLGVRKFRERFTARINDTFGRGIQIGTFDTPEQASAAYWAAKNSMYPEAVIA